MTYRLTDYITANSLLITSRPFCNGWWRLVVTAPALRWNAVLVMSLQLKPVILCSESWRNHAVSRYLALRLNAVGRGHTGVSAAHSLESAHPASLCGRTLLMFAGAEELVAC